MYLFTFAFAVMSIVGVSGALGDEGAPELAPLAFVQFCTRQPAECRATGQRIRQVTLTRSINTTIQDVNWRVNREIVPRQLLPGEYWVVGSAEGNCNDYAVTKRHLLIAMGFPTSAVRLAAVKTHSRLDHLVVIIKTNAGDMVLDNLSSTVLTLSKTGYLVTKEQSGRDPKLWVRPSDT